MKSISEMGDRLEYLASGNATAANAAELLLLGEDTLKHWVLLKGLKPTSEKREGFQLLALHRQGSQGDPSFNACRETCRELVYHYNLLTLGTDITDLKKNALMMTLVANHLFLFVSGKMETQQLGDFCCSSKPLHAEVS